MSDDGPGIMVTGGKLEVGGGSEELGTVLLVMVVKGYCVSLNRTWREHRFDQIKDQGIDRHFE